MSSGARLSIAVVCVISGIGFGYAAVAFPDIHARWILWAITIVCFIIVASCFQGKHSAVTNRIIGAVIFFIYVAYLIDEIREGDWVSVSRATPCVISALLGLIIWGLPAGYVMVHGHLPYNPFQESPFPDGEDMAEPCDENRHYLRK